MAFSPASDGASSHRVTMSTRPSFAAPMTSRGTVPPASKTVSMLWTLIIKIGFMKFRGHRNAHVTYSDSYAVDADAGGLIIFSGTDHVHFRPVLRDEYYSVLLLHYCPAAGCDADPFSRRSPFVGLDDRG